MDAYEIKRRAKLLEQSEQLDTVCTAIHTTKQNRPHVVTLPEMDNVFYTELREFLRTQSRRLAALATS